MIANLAEHRRRIEKAAADVPKAQTVALAETFVPSAKWKAHRVLLLATYGSVLEETADFMTNLAPDDLQLVTTRHELSCVLEKHARCLEAMSLALKIKREEW